MPKGVVLTLEMPSYFLNNSIVIIKSLGAGELDTAKTIHEFLLGLSKDGLTIELHEAQSKTHVLEILSDVRERSKMGLKPIVHFETHGNKDHGLHISKSNEFVSWEELIEKFREINIATNNNLGVVMAACFGLYAIKPIKIFEPSPFFVLIASLETVGAGYIHDQIKLFYKGLLTDGDLDSGLAEIDEKFKPFHSEKFFTISVIKYFRQACVGRGGGNRRERLVTMALDGIRNPTKIQLKAIRKGAKKFIKPNQVAFQRIADRFIIDQNKYVVTFTQIMKMVRGKNAV
jgi:hypothetical protein